MPTQKLPWQYCTLAVAVTNLTASFHNFSVTTVVAVAVVAVAVAAVGAVPAAVVVAAACAATTVAASVAAVNYSKQSNN